MEQVRGFTPLEYIIHFNTQTYADKRNLFNFRMAPISSLSVVIKTIFFFLNKKQPHYSHSKLLVESVTKIIYLHFLKRHIFIKL